METAGGRFQHAPVQKAIQAGILNLFEPRESLDGSKLEGHGRSSFRPNTASTPMSNNRRRTVRISVSVKTSGVLRLTQFIHGGANIA